MVSEVRGLRWSDFDFDAGVMHVQRGIVYNVVGQPKSDSFKSRMRLRRARFTEAVAE
jgi:integrase